MRDLDAYLISKGLPTEPRFGRLNGFLGIDIEIPKRFIHLEKELAESIVQNYSKSDVSMAIKEEHWCGDVKVKAVRYPGAKDYSPKGYIDGLVADLYGFVTAFIEKNKPIEKKEAAPVVTVTDDPIKQQASCCGNCQNKPYDRRRGYTGNGDDFYSAENTGDFWAFRELGREYHTTLPSVLSSDNTDTRNWYQKEYLHRQSRTSY